MDTDCDNPAATLDAALLRGDGPLVESLLDRHPALLTPRLWPIAMFQAESQAMTRLLLLRGLDPNQCSAPRKPLHFAVEKGWPDIIAELLAAGARPDIRDGEGFTPLDLFGGLVRVEPGIKAVLIRLLREAGAPVTLWTALRLGETGEALALLEADPSLVHVVSPDLGFLPLHVAARMADLAMVEALLARGAEVDAGRNTALWFACQSDRDGAARVAVARRLLTVGADPNRRCEEGTTPLHLAAWRGPVEMAACLLEHGADPSLAAEDARLAADYARQSAVLADAPAMLRMLDAQEGTERFQ